MIIKFSGRLNLNESLYSGQAFRWRAYDSWNYGILFGQIIKIRQRDNDLEFYSSSGCEEEIESLLKRYLRLDDNLEKIYEEISKGVQIISSIQNYSGLRILDQEPWECMISFICSANSNIPRISKNIEDIANTFGEPLEMDGQLRRTFPSADVLADVSIEELRKLGLGFRAKYVSAAANMISEGAIDLYTLKESSYDEALESLVTVPGIGDKVGNCITLFSLNKLESFPVDVWIDRALREWYPKLIDKNLTRSKMRPWAQEFFGEYAGYANQYLFHGRRLQDKITK